MEEQLFNWLTGQSPIVLIMGVAIYILYKNLKEKEAKVNELYEKNESLSKDTIKLTILYEEKTEKLATDDKESKKEIISLLQEIREIVKESLKEIIKK